MNNYKGYVSIIVTLPDGNVCNDYWACSIKEILVDFGNNSRFQYYFPIPYTFDRLFPVRIAEMSEDGSEMSLEEAWD